jgi:hypothetical protein
MSQVGDFGRGQNLPLAALPDRTFLTKTYQKLIDFRPAPLYRLTLSL